MRVVITGCARGIGRELARQYATAGAEVWATVRAPEEAPGLSRFGVRVEVVDVTVAASVGDFGARLGHAPVALLINNAGVLGPARQSTADMDFDGFADTLAVNVLGPLRVTQALHTQLRAAAGAKVAVITSRMGSLSYAKSDHVAYRASKAAVNKVTQCLATDLESQGIAVAAIHPGWVRTNIGGEEADLDVSTSADGVRAVIANLELGCTGRFWNYDGTELSW